MIAAASQDIGPVMTAVLGVAPWVLIIGACVLLGRRKTAATTELPATDDPEVTE